MPGSNSTLKKSFSFCFKKFSLPIFTTIGGIGVALRLYQYFSNRSLWLDEALLSLNIINRSFFELITPLDNYQGAPIGFLWVEKAITLFLGTNEWALRLFPLFSGLLSLPIFYLVARRILSLRSTFFALTLFAISSPLIYYASEVKQYSTDVLVTLIALMILFPLLNGSLTYWGAFLYGLLGALLIWLSHPVIFVLASIGLVGLMTTIQTHTRRQVGSVTLLGLLWSISFLIFYYISLNELAQKKELLDYWIQGFAPPIANVPGFVTWVVESFLAVFRYPVGLSLTGLATLTYFVGLGSLFGKNKPCAFALSLPILLALLAAIVGQYPFRDRLLLFLVPLLMLVLAEGIDQTISLFFSARWRIVGLMFAVLLFYHPLIDAGDYLKGPELREEIKPAISHIATNWQEGDIIYVYYASQSPFEYYLPRYNFQPDDYRIGVSSRSNWSGYLSDLDKLSDHRRVWLLFSHVHVGHGVNEELLFINYLTTIGGVQKDKFQTIGAAAYLYEFNNGHLPE